jgi:hypothetical protein
MAGYKHSLRAVSDPGSSAPTADIDFFVLIALLVACVDTLFLSHSFPFLVQQNTYRLLGRARSTVARVAIVQQNFKNELF